MIHPRLSEMMPGMINGTHLVNDGLDTFDHHEEICLNNRRPAYTYNQGVLLSGIGHVWARRGGDALLRVAVQIVRAVRNSTLVHSGTGGVLREESDETDPGHLPNLYTGSPGTDGLQFKCVKLLSTPRPPCLTAPRLCSACSPRGRRIEPLRRSVLLRHLRYLVDVLDASGERGQAAIAKAGGNLTAWRAWIVTNGDSIWRRAACVAPAAVSADASVQVPPLFGYEWLGPCAWAFGGPSATTQSVALDVFVAAIST